MKTIFWNFLSVFCLLFILTFKFEYSILPEIYQWINPFFEKIVSFSGEYLFGRKEGFNPEISSDSLGLYIHAFNLIWISISLTILLKVLFKNKEVNLRLYLFNSLVFYLSIQLLIYGLDKVFKAQFFFPEPNTLFTPIKDLCKDIMYWSTIGLSRGYSLFLGGAEILVAVFLWFRKTRLIAIVLGTGIMINVVAVNFSFDISVKVYSLFLLLSFIIPLSPYFNYLYGVFTQKENIQKPKEETEIFTKFQPKKWLLKAGIISLFLVEGFTPYLQTGNFNDDTFERPKFHGAYSVIENEMGIKNVFIHRYGYLIFQNEKDEFQDFKMELDSVNNKILIFDYRTKKKFPLNYKSEKNTLTWIEGKILNQEITLQLNKVDLSNFQKMQSGFNWVEK
ncbi:hypothetical protein OAD28_00090 [Flavobacteriales bacterium]|nr:hypothetical protein [Flavobacteriales bacterium]